MCTLLLAILATLLPLVALVKFLIALRSSCDTETLRAKMPASAYRDKVVWVTGASSGIGKELACQLGKHGAKLILTARSAKALEETKAEIVSAGAPPQDVVVLTADMEQLAHLPSVTAKAIEAHGGIDVLVNNAGFTQRDTGANTLFEVDVKMCNVNYLSCVCLAKGVLPSMSARGGGRLINISSVAGKCGVALRTSYCGTKHAVVGFFDALRVEEHARGSGIGVTNVCPGSVRTNVARNAILATADSRRGDTDANIEAGLDPVWVCDRILSAAYSNVDECWIAGGIELAGCYINQYFPSYFKTIMRKKAAGVMKATLAAVEK